MAYMLVLTLKTVNYRQKMAKNIGFDLNESLEHVSNRRLSHEIFHVKGYLTSRKKGNLGEDIACKYLVKQGYNIIKRNYLKKWGELDIIAEKDKIIHFFEVKAVTFNFLGKFDSHRPEDNVNAAKLGHLRRVIETYLYENTGGLDAAFQFHVICIHLDYRKRVGRLKVITNIIL